MGIPFGRSAAENEGKIKTDTLQRLHSVSNLAELLEAGHQGIPPTLRDSSLRYTQRISRGPTLGDFARKSAE
jgi:hypothetical protein